MSEISDALREGYTPRENRRKTGQFGRCSANGKGDAPRPTNRKLYAENYDAIFRKTKPRV
jgi:hypothetical protein